MKQLNQIATIHQARYYLKTRPDELAELFNGQYPNNSTGGFHNPRARSFYRGEIEFFCHYDGYDNEDDGWTWVLDVSTGKFSN